MPLSLNLCNEQKQTYKESSHNVKLGLAMVEIHADKQHYWINFFQSKDEWNLTVAYMLDIITSHAVTQ